MEVDLANYDPYGGKRSDLYSSNWGKLDSLIVEGVADIPDDIFGYNKRLNLYLLDDSPDKIFIEMGDPYFSPYIDAVKITEVTIFGVYSDGKVKPLSKSVVAPGIESTMHETELLTYEFEKPEGFDLDADAFSKFKSIAFENGVNQQQFSALMALEVERTAEAKQALARSIEDSRNESERVLKTEWGDKYEQKLESAKSVLNHEGLASDEFKQFLNDTRFGDNPQVIRLFAKLAELISEA